jgi:selenocysteine lyase/cysteine desulfurase
MGVLGDVPGVEVITSERHAGLVSLRLASVDPEAVVERLWRRGVIVRSIESPMALRFSLGFFNTPEEIDSAALALGEELGALG